MAAAAGVVVLVFLKSSYQMVEAENGVSAIFVFGDSLVDVGNNNFLHSAARANYYPYGVDFTDGPTGRFSNGRTVIDMFVDMLGIPNAPEFSNPDTSGDRILNGVNYASAAAGILDETGRHYALQSVGVKKLVIAGLGPLGCIPNQRATGVTLPGRCADKVNEMLGAFNEGLKSLVTQLNSQYPDTKFVYTNIYGIFGDILNNPETYGFSVVDTACCGVGLNRGQITCLPLQFPCLNRNEYVFWDAFHPTEAASYILAGRAFRGPPSDSYPINVQQLALI
ncbi:hypothetical protein Csa_013496 [Cucumis sativus]|nr:hypothetical protein Csa_013496 [Cucumis sativus]